MPETSDCAAAELTMNPNISLLKGKCSTLCATEQDKFAATRVLTGLRFIPKSKSPQQILSAEQCKD